MNWLTSWLAPAPAPRPRRARPAVEPLEARDLPTGFGAAVLDDPPEVGPGWFARVAAPGTGAAAEGSSDWVVSLTPAAAAAVGSVADAARFFPATGGVRFEVLRGLGARGQLLVRATGPAAAAALRALPGVAAADPDARIVGTAAPNDPRYGELWALDNTGQTGGRADADIDRPEAAALGAPGGVVVVGVIDSGVDYTHPDLAANVWRNPGEVPGDGIDNDGNGFADDVFGWDFVGDDADPRDEHGHGTHVAGTVAAVEGNGVGVTGVAGNAARVMALRVLGADGRGSFGAAVAAVNYATMMRQRGAPVVVTNHSYGGYIPGFDGTPFYRTMRDAFAAHARAGVLAVTAAGNDARDADATPHYPGNIGVPGVLNVAATTDRDELAAFSNVGARTVHLAAPGQSILSTVPGGYRLASGTSMAAPHVAGAAALLFAHRPTLTAEAAQNLLTDGADRLPALAGRTASGGRLNVANSLRLALGRTPDDHGDTPEAATPLPGGAVRLAAGTVRDAADCDVFALTLARPRVVNLHAATGGGALRPVIEVAAAADPSRVVADSRGTPADQPAGVVVRLAAGTYFVTVSARAAGAGDAGAYELLVAVDNAGSVGEKHAALGGAGGQLGPARGGVTPVRGGVGAFQQYQNGRVYDTARGGVHYVSGAVYREWVRRGAHRGPLGLPLSDPRAAADGLGGRFPADPTARVQYFEGGYVYQSRATGVLLRVGGWPLAAGGSEADADRPLAPPPPDGPAPVLALARTGTPSGRTEVLVLAPTGDAAAPLRTIPTALHETGDDYDLDFLDYNRDGVTDLAAVKQQGGSGSTEVHVLDGATDFQTYLTQSPTALHPTGDEADLHLADVTGDGRPDLVYVKRFAGAGTTEVHALDGATGFQTFVVHRGTALHETAPPHAFAVADYNADGRPDLWFVDRAGGSGKVEVHVLDAATGFQTFLLHAATVADAQPADAAFRVADANRDGRPDLQIDRTDAGTLRTVVLDGSVFFEEALVVSDVDLDAAADLHAGATAGADAVLVRDRPGDPTRYEVVVNGTVARAGLWHTLTSLTVDAGAGDDRADAPAAGAALHGVAVRLLMGDGNDVAFGGAGADYLDGGAGADVLSGLAGDDTIQGGTGDDQLHGYEGNDLIFGHDGNDLIGGGAGADVLYGQGGDDLVYGHEGNDGVFGGTGNDHLLGNEGDDSVGPDAVFGEPGDDVLEGGAGSDYLFGGEGNDVLWGGTAGAADAADGTDTLDGGDGRDVLMGQTGADDLIGGAGSDELYGGPGGDRLRGGDGDDVVFGEADGDDLDGGAGNDWVNGADGADVVRGGPDADRLEGGFGADGYESDAADVVAEVDAAEPEPTPVEEPTPIDPIVPDAEPTPVDPDPTPVDPDPTPVDPGPVVTPPAGGGPAVVLVGSTGVAVGGPGGVRVLGGAGFGAAVAGGPRVAVADLTGDGVPDVATGTDPGTLGMVVVTDGATGREALRFEPFAGFTGGVFVAAADITGDGVAELVVTPDEGGGPRVRVLRGGDFAPVADFFGIDDPNFRGGARAAAGDLTGDGFADLVVSAGFGGGPRVAVYDGAALARGERVKPVQDFFLFEAGLRNGAYVAVGDVDGDGFAEVVGGAGPGGGPRVLAVSGRVLLAEGGAAAVARPVANFFPGDPGGRGGVRVAVKNLDGDRFADVVTGDGAGGGARAAAYRGRDFAGGGAGELFALDAFPGTRTGVYVG